MSGPVFKPEITPIMKVDKPHAPYGKHVDLITPFGLGADKMRIGENGQMLTHDLVLKGGKEFKI